MTAQTPTAATMRAHTPAAVVLRAFQIIAYAEGGLLPAILLVAVVNWVSGYGAPIVAIVGATHGAAFTAYVLLLPAVARLLGWSLHTTSVALSVAFVPFAPWAFARRIRRDLTSGSRRRRPRTTSKTSTTPDNYPWGIRPDFRR